MTSTHAEKRLVVTDAESFFRRIIARSFPDGSRIICIPRQAEIVFLISWRLRWHLRDAGSPVRSRIIRLAISDDIVDRYELSPAPERRATEGRVEKVLKEMVADFDPTPQRTHERDSEVVSWQLTLGDDKSA